MPGHTAGLTRARWLVNKSPKAPSHSACNPPNGGDKSTPCTGFPFGPAFPCTTTCPCPCPSRASFWLNAPLSKAHARYMQVRIMRLRTHKKAGRASGRERKTERERGEGEGKVEQGRERRKIMNKRIIKPANVCDGVAGCARMLPGHAAGCTATRIHRGYCGGCGDLLHSRGSPGEGE